MHDLSEGVSLLEVLITLSIICVIALAASFGMQGLLHSSQGAATLQNLRLGIEIAKSTAVKSRKAVTVCRSSNGSSCQGNWHEGAIVFLDPDGKLNPDSQDLIVHRVPATTGTVYWRAFQNRQYLRFAPSGELLNQNGNFLYCPADRNPEHADQIIVNRIGRVRWAQDSDGNGVKEDAQGRPLACP